MIRLSNGYKTIKGPVRSEFKVKKSKFIGYLLPVETKEAAESFIESINKKHYDANHNVPVYIIGNNSEIQKYSDDGEPSGTAGMPMLDLLKNEGFTNIAVVVTRYFGGTKLGTGGLVRAYTKSLSLALEGATVLEKKKYVYSEMLLDYTLHGKFINYIKNNGAIILFDEVFTNQVQIKMFIKPKKFDKIKDEINDMSAGTIKIEIIDQKFLTFENGNYQKEG
jgi:uncharacterized YigZ family protein